MAHAEKVKIGETEYTAHGSGFWFDSRTAPDVCETIARVGAAKRVRVFYGDTQTGKAWAEENDVSGYVGRSCGRVKVPLLIANSRSMGGGAMLSHCIVAIVRTSDKKCIYKHPTFDAGEWRIAPPSADGFAAEVLHNGKVHARFKSEESANRYCQFMRGERFNK